MLQKGKDNNSGLKTDAVVPPQHHLLYPNLPLNPTPPSPMSVSCLTHACAYKISVHFYSGLDRDTSQNTLWEKSSQRLQLCIF